MGSRGKTILLTGEMSSGKTTLFYYLKSGQFVDTVTSIQPNTQTFPLKGFGADVAIGDKAVPVYDLPGHGTFKSLLPKVLPETKSLFFLVDSNATSFSSAAQSLYHYLTNEHIFMAQIPIIIVCTKIDQAGSMPLAMIKSKLQQEIEVIRKAHENLTQLDAVGSETNELRTIPLTEGDEVFTFDKTDVQWVNISTKSKTNVDSLVKFL